MNVQVVLIQDVPNLGGEGQVCTVKAGYARNYLFPQKYALPHNNTTLSVMKSRASIIEKKREEKLKSVLSMKESLQGSVFRARSRAAESGKLFGSITNANILEALEAEGIQLDRRNLHLEPHSVRQIGVYRVRLDLYASESIDLPLEVEALSSEQEREVLTLWSAEKIRAEQETKEEEAGEQVASTESEASIEASPSDAVDSTVLEEPDSHQETLSETAYQDSSDVDNS